MMESKKLYEKFMKSKKGEKDLVSKKSKDGKKQQTLLPFLVKGNLVGEI